MTLVLGDRLAWPKELAGRRAGRARDTIAEDAEDAELARSARAGDRAAFEAIVRRYQKRLYYLALRYVRSEADAADICQRAFVRAFRGLESLRDGASLRTWLYRIGINLALNHIRDRRPDTELCPEQLSAAPVGADRLEAEQRRRALAAAIADLPPKQRLVIELRIYDELPFREVAELADCTENAAKVNYHHAVKKLRARLSPREESP